jgi:hypothetical protein
MVKLYVVLKRIEIDGVVYGAQPGDTLGLSDEKAAPFLARGVVRPVETPSVEASTAVEGE